MQINSSSLVNTGCLSVFMVGKGIPRHSVEAARKHSGDSLPTSPAEAGAGQGLYTYPAARKTHCPGPAARKLPVPKGPSSPAPPTPTPSPCSAPKTAQPSQGPQGPSLHSTGPEGLLLRSPQSLIASILYYPKPQLLPLRSVRIYSDRGENTFQVRDLASNAWKSGQDLFGPFRPCVPLGAGPWQAWSLSASVQVWPALAGAFCPSSLKIGAGDTSGGLQLPAPW